MQCCHGQPWQHCFFHISVRKIAAAVSHERYGHGDLHLENQDQKSDLLDDVSDRMDTIAVNDDVQTGTAGFRLLSDLHFHVVELDFHTVEHGITIGCAGYGLILGVDHLNDAVQNTPGDNYLYAYHNETEMKRALGKWLQIMEICAVLEGEWEQQFSAEGNRIS